MVDVTSDENIIKANLIATAEPIKANLVKTAEPIQATPTTTPSASEEIKGMIRIATEEEAMAGVLNNVAITPHTLELKTTTFTFEQAIASDTWVINHNLNKYPSVTIVDTAGTQFQGRVEYIDKNNCIVYMNGATKGKAYLN